MNREYKAPTMLRLNLCISTHWPCDKGILRQTHTRVCMKSPKPGIRPLAGHRERMTLDTSTQHTRRPGRQPQFDTNVPPLRAGPDALQNRKQLFIIILCPPRPVQAVVAA